MRFLSSSQKGKKIIRVICIVLAALFVLTTLAAVLPTIVRAEDAYYTADKLIRVGLYYGSTSLRSIAFSSPEGIEIGSFDSGNGAFFASVASISDTVTAEIDTGALTMCFTDADTTELMLSEPETTMYLRGVSGNPITIAGVPYAGLIELACSSYGMRVVNLVYMETYIKGVVASEVYSTWPEETLKAQAIVARSFTLTNFGKHAGDGFDICSTSHCQVYKGLSGTQESTDLATDATRGLVVVYDGAPALTTYHSSSGEANESAQSAWGSKPELYPYLTSVHTGFDECASYPNGKWSYTVTARELTDYINSQDTYKGKLVGLVDSIECEHIGTSPYVYRITVKDAQGNEINVEKSTSVRNFLLPYCKSACFTVSSVVPVRINEGDTYLLDSQKMYVISANGTDTLRSPTTALRALSAEGLTVIGNATQEKVFTISGEGYGHGVGMSQFGAMTLAERGYDYQYILNLYYPGTEIKPYTSLSIS